MKFKKKKLSNGLVIIGEINKSAKSTAVGFFVKTGSRDETKQINGVSHFLEHMLFKGTEELNAFEVNEAFDRTGAQFNAFTSEENTVFYAGVLPEYLVEVTGLWIELMRPALRDEDFEIEKNVIKEEIAMCKDLPSYDVMDRCRRLHFGTHPCGNSVLGKEESIDKLTAEQMRSYFSNRYAPNNMVLSYAGNFDWDRIYSIAQDCCSKWQKPPAVLLRLPQRLPTQVGAAGKSEVVGVGRKLEHCPGSKRRERVEKSNLAREHICLMSPAVSAQDPRRFAASLLAVIIGDDVGSRFFWELVDRALAEAATMQFEAMDGTGIFYSYIRCSSENVPKVLDTISSIFRSLSKSGITKDELKKSKNKILSALVIKNELPMGRLIDLGFNWTYLKQYRTIEDDISAIRAVSVDDVHSLIEKFKPGDFTQLSIGPAQSS